MKRLLVAAAGLAVLAGPVAASAQSQPDWRTNHQDRQTQAPAPRQAPAYRPESRPAPQTYRAPQQNFQYRAPQQNFQRVQPAPQYRGGNNAYGNQGAHTTWRGTGANGQPQPVQPQPTYRGQYQRNGATNRVPMDRGGNGQYQYRNRGQYQNGGQYQYRNGGQQQSRNRGQYQYRNGGNGYQNFQNWSGSNVRLRGDWWRGRQGFSGYYGRRDGYWFAPGWGYYQVDPRWWGFDWLVGSIVPYDLQSYYVYDPYAYGLPPAPYGCEWIFLGDQIVLIDLESGQILEIAGQY